MRKYDLQFLEDTKNFKYHSNGTKILKEYTILHSDIYNREIEHYEGVAYAPHILRAIARLQWSDLDPKEAKDKSIYFYLRLKDEDILKRFRGATLTQIHNFTQIPIETIRRKVNTMIKKGWLMKKGKEIIQTRKWLHYHVPVAVMETDRMLEAANKISNLILEMEKK